MNRSSLFSTLILLALCPLAACDDPVSPDLDAVSAMAPVAGIGEAGLTSPCTGAPYVGLWAEADLSFTLAHDTTLNIGGGPVRFFSGQGILDGEDVVVSAFEVGQGLALYVDRFIGTDVLEPLLYGIARVKEGLLLYETSYPEPTDYALRRIDRRRPVAERCPSSRAVFAHDAVSLQVARAEAVERHGARRPEDPFMLDLSTGAYLPGGRVLTFDAIGPDGRCPLDATCVWEGEVEAHFTLHTPGGAFPLVMTLPGVSPDALPLKRAPRVSADSLLVRLLRLDPYPGFVPPVTTPPVGPMPPTAVLVVEPCPEGLAICGPVSTPDDVSQVQHRRKPLGIDTGVSGPGGFPRP